MTAVELTIDIRSYWHAGGGRGAGAVLDAVVHRDPDGLPVLPGRHLKGLLRDALRRAEAWGWEGFETDVTRRLFGGLVETDGTRYSEPGTLRVSDATLPAPLVRWLAGPGREHQPALFRGLYATAVEHESGTARDKTLRGVEVTVPLALTARVEPIPGRVPPDDWPRLIERVLPLVEAVGAHRSRGLGRAVLRLAEVNP